METAYQIKASTKKIIARFLFFLLSCFLFVAIFKYMATEIL